jgi:DNA-binding LacI/PurR family transcriptional regulator
VAVTIYDVARRAGVSITTVSHVIHNRGNIPESTKKRVMEVMREIDYAPNRIAQRLATRKTQSIALLIPTIDNPFFAELYNGIEAYIEQEKPEYRVMIGNIRYSAEKERALIRTFRQELLDGYIIVSNDPRGDEISQLFREEIPVVFAVNDRSAVPRRPLVTYNNDEMAHRLTEYLLTLGHRSFAYLGAIVDRSERAQSRLKGFRTCLEEHGVAFDPAFFVNGSEYSSRCGYDSFKQLIRSGPVPTALFCANDVLAIGALHAIRERGLKVPEDLSITGYDNIPVSEYLDPPLTTVDIKPSVIGFEAADILFKLIQADRVKRTRRIIPGELILRESCGPPP